MKRFAFAVLMMLVIIPPPAFAGKIPRPSGGGGHSITITEYDARALTLEINRNNGTIVFYEPEDDKDKKNHRVLFWAERFPQGTASFDRDNYKWSTDADGKSINLTIKVDTKTGKATGAADIPPKFVTCAEANPNPNNLAKRNFRVSELEEKGLQIRTYEPRLECLLYAHLAVEKGKRQVTIIPVTINMIARFLPDGNIDGWLAESLNIPLPMKDDDPRVPRDRFLTRGCSPEEEGDGPHPCDIDQSEIEGEKVLTVFYRNDSVDYYNPTEPKLDVTGQAAATVEHGTSTRTSILLILALAVGLFGALRQALIGWNIRKGAARSVAEPGWGGKITLGVIALSGASAFAYSFSLGAALAIVGIICLLVVGAGKAFETTAPNGG